MIKCEWLINLIVILVVLTSGTVFFHVVNGRIFILLLLIFCIILLVKVRKMNKYNLFVFLVILSLLALNTLINLRYEVNYKELLILIINIFIAFVVSNSLTDKAYKEKYIRVVSVISLMSIVFFYLSKLISYTRFPFVREYEKFVYSPYHTFLWKTEEWLGNLDRNCGMFWEPGVFQAHLSLAILFLVENYKRSNLKYIALLVITMITTKSTAGYINLLLIFMILLRKYIKNSTNIKKQFYMPFLLIMVLVVFYIIYFSPTIQQKFNMTNSSFIIRSSDLRNSLDILRTYPIFGTGYYSSRAAFEQYVRNIINNSSALLFMAYLLGIPIFSTFLAFLLLGVKDLFKKVDFVIVILVVFNTLMNEAMLFMPAYLILLYKFQKHEI